MNLIAAVDKKWGLGYEGQLLVRIPEDMKRFRALTLGKVVVMGRKTLQSLPGGNPLAKRTNIVLSRRGNLDQEDIIHCKSLSALFEVLARHRPEDIFVIGGAEIYSQLLPYCSVAYITKIEKEFEADVFFPNLDEDEAWFVEDQGEMKCHQDVGFRYVLYKRQGQGAK